jgi:DNA-binding MarR family transcriptional regulator
MDGAETLEGRSRSGTRDPAVLSWMRLMRVHQQISQAIEAHTRACGLTQAQFVVLAQVGAVEGRPQQELAQALQVTKGNVTQILDRMEGCGLLERRQAGRTKCVHLTARGRQVYEQVVPAVDALLADQMRSLTLAEQHELLRLLGLVERDLRQRAAVD